MKKILLILLSLLPITTFAQKVTENDWYDLSAIKDIRKFNLEIDFSEAIILNWEAADFIAEEPAWEDGIKVMRKNFINAFHKQTGKGNYTYRIGNYPELQSTIYVKALEVKERGTHIDALITITNEDGDVVFTKKVKGESGLFGSTVNLMGDAMEDLGKVLGGKMHTYGRPGINKPTSNKPFSRPIFQKSDKESESSDGE